MKSFATVLALITLVPTVLGLTINTPLNVVQCQPILLTWTGGTPPYFLSIIPGSQPSAPALRSFPTQTGTSITWNVDIAAGTGITISLKDNTGTQAYSDVVNILSSSNSSCVSTSVAVGGATAGSSVSGSKTASSGSASGTGSKSSSATATSKPNSGSRSSAGVYGLASFMGLVGAALF